uniref:Centrosomal protein 89 n=1 Tax=Neolamprologus brichardi TaxID=32507 RepID=A0A3Q4GJ88_NEOBR
AVPRTPPPRSPNPSPERPRSALAAAILSSSLTGQTWAIPPARLMSLSESGQSESFTSEPNISTALYTRDRWSEDLVSRPRLSSPDQSEGELEDKEQEVVDEEDGEEHVYHTLDRRQNSSLTESVYALPLKAKVRSCRKSLYYVQAELQNLRQHAQELVDENDALKLTVHRLNVELSHYQARFRPLSKEEHSKVSGLPNTGSPPPWLVDMKYSSPLLLAYEDRMNEKDAILQTTEENMEKLHVQLEEVIKENEKLHDEITKTGAVNQKDCYQIQQQAVLVLQENQVLINQLEAQHAEAKDTHSRHNTEVAKVSKKMMLLEVENQRLEGDLEESRRELQKNKRDLQVLQARLKDAVTWDEHCSIAGKLRRQLEQHESRSKDGIDKLLLRVSNLQEENRILALDKAQLTAKTRAMEAELDVLCLLLSHT